MSLEKSKYATRVAGNSTKKKVEPNPWREVPVSESNLIDGLTYAMRIHRQLNASEVIERVIVGEPINGVYPLSVAIIKRKEV